MSNNKIVKTPAPIASNSAWSHFKTTLARDLFVLLHRRSFWWWLALWSLLSAVLFFSYLEDFLAIQPTLRAKQFRYGVTDLVLIPYLKTLSLVSVVFMAGLCARLFYLEQFSPFSALYRGLAQRPVVLVLAKCTYVAILSALALGVIILPVLGAGWFFDYNVFRILITTVGLYLLLFTTGVLTMLFSQIFSHSVVVVLLVVLLLGGTELAVKLMTEPVWLSPIVMFFSPISHVNRLATGVWSLSDGLFFGFGLCLLIGLSIRRFKNTYFVTH